MFTELVESNKDNFMDIMRYAYKDPHNFLFININSQRLFSMFDELIIHDEHDDDIEKPL